MAKNQAQDSIEHLKEILEKATLDLIGDASGVQRIEAHTVAERMVEKFASGPSHEGNQLCREFVETFVKSVHAEKRLSQYLDKHPAEMRSYKSTTGICRPAA